MNKYANQMANDAKDLNNQAANQANKAFNTVDSKIDEYKGKASDALNTAEDQAYKIAQTVGEYVQRILGDNGRRVANAKETAEDTIKTHPLTSAAVAFTGGLLVAALLGIGNRK